MRKLALALALFLPLVSQAAIVKKDFEYNLAGRKYEGYVVFDDAKKDPRPGVLVSPNWLGVSAEAKEKAEKIAGLGYVAFVVDVYGKGNGPKDDKEAAALSGSFKKDRTALRIRMQQGLKVLREQPGVDKSRIAVVGYCFGGLAALELARTGADVKSVVSFHGSLDSRNPAADGKKIKAKVLALHGADDPFVPAQNVADFEEEMKKGGVEMQLVKYPGAVHSFTDKSAGNDNSKGAAYNKEADQKSWSAMQDFLKKTL